MLRIKNFIILIFFVGSSAFGQTVLVTKQDQRVKGKNTPGYATTLEASKDEVNASLTRYLKTFGRPKSQDELLVVTEPSLNGQVYQKPLYAISKGTGATATAWIGVKLEEWGEDSTNITSQLEGFVKSFGVNFYRDKIQAQIEEAQHAVEAVEKQQQRTATENKNLSQRIENNKTEKVQLIKALESNRLDSVNLQLRMQKNMESKDSLVIVLEKVKKAVLFQQERQRKVN